MALTYTADGIGGSGHLCRMVCDSISGDGWKWAAAGKEDRACAALECLLICALSFVGWIRQREDDRPLIDAGQCLHSQNHYC